MPEAGSVYATKVSSLQSPSYVVPDKASERAECQRLSQDYSMAMNKVSVLVSTKLQSPKNQQQQNLNRSFRRAPVQTQVRGLQPLRESQC
jgi:hypothetical protein